MVDTRRHLKTIFGRRTRNSHDSRHHRVVTFFARQLMHNPFRSGARHRTRGRHQGRNRPYKRATNSGRQGNGRRHMKTSRSRITIHRVSRSSSTMRRNMTRNRGQVRTTSFRAIRSLASRRGSQVTRRPSFLIISSIRILFFLVPHIFHCFTN